MLRVEPSFRCPVGVSNICQMNTPQCSANQLSHSVLRYGGFRRLSLIPPHICSWSHS